MPQKLKKSQNTGKKHEKPDAIILSGGMLGRKNLFPKALIEHDGKTILEHQIEYLGDLTGKIVIACKPGECVLIKKHLGEMTDVDYSEDANPPLGTAGAVKKAIEKTKSENILVLNVDSLTDIDLNALINFGPDTVCVANPRLDFGVIKANQADNGVLEFREKPLIKELWVNCGLYYLNRQTILNKLPDVGSLERDTFPFMKIKAFKHQGIFKHF
jgi:NDP-sugar pyrophosphorylase family protein